MSAPHWTAEQIPDQTGRVAIVTGANSGIGLETALALAARGATTIVASRNEARGNQAVADIKAKAPEASVELMQLDLASLASVERFAHTFRARFARLDLLINNAGVMMPPRRQETSDGFELQMGTNHLGHFALTLRLIDLVVGTPGGRVVNVSSSAQNLGGIKLDDLQWTARRYKRMGSYAQSKIANMLFTLELQRRLAEAGASTLVTAAHPGWTVTNLQKDTWLFRTFNPWFGMAAWQGALPTLYAAISDDVTPGGYYGPHGFQNIRGYPVANRPAKASMDAELASGLWRASEQLTGLTLPEFGPVAA